MNLRRSMLALIPFPSQMSLLPPTSSFAGITALAHLLDTNSPCLPCSLMSASTRVVYLPKPLPARKVVGCRVYLILYFDSSFFSLLFLPFHSLFKQVGHGTTHLHTHSVWVSGWVGG